MTGGEKAPRPNWFVGAMHRGGEDQIDHFLSEGIWENRYEDKYLDDVRSMHPGDRIAIKSTCNRKRDLPFDNQGNFVAVMKINAIGTITGNRNDGKCVDVNWITKKKTEREWYFYRCLLTIWRVLPKDWMANDLLEFTFEGKSQDIDRFRNDEFWKGRFGQQR